MKVISIYSAIEACKEGAVMRKTYEVSELGDMLIYRLTFPLTYSIFNLAL